nr:sensor histidine kinase [Motilibacter deserti]
MEESLEGDIETRVAALRARVSDPFERRRRLGWAVAAVWLFFLGDPLSQAWHADNTVARHLGILALVAFAVTYVLSFRLMRAIPPESEAPPLPLRLGLIAAMLGLGALAVPGAGESALATLVYVAAAAVMLLPGRQRIAAVGLLAAASVTLPAAVPGWSADTGLVFGIVVASTAVFGMTKVVERNRQLLRAYEEIARLAVSEERSRMARDLHDILGHSLTVVTVKAELAGRLLPDHPGRAASEVADIERLSREALADVRSTIRGAREVTLAGELASARAALTGAGIDADLPSAIDEVPGDRRELFGWVVREGVTNVVRHSGARRCTVHVGRDSVEVVDDGRGPSSALDGSGLAGLHERARAAGARLTVARAGPHGGFRLRVELAPPAASMRA